MANVLVTDGEQRAALAVVRSLGAAGHRVYVCGARARSLAAASRYCTASAALPDALTDPAAFLDGLADHARRWSIDVLIPIAEPALLAILPARDRFPGVRIPFAPADRFVRICDKAAVFEAAAAEGIRVPAQVVLSGPEDAALRSGELRFPLVLKPARSVAGDGAERVKTSVLHVDSPAALAGALAKLPRAAYPILAQERVVGPGTGIFVLMKDGELRAAFAHRRLREKPPSGGVSVYRESVPLDRDLLDRSLALLRRFAWEGVAMVEYKVSAATGIPYIMEINGRFWGSLQLAIDAGVDFPRLLLDDDPAAEPVTEYRLGVRSRWEWGEVDHLLARFRRTPEELALPAGAPGRARAALDFLAAIRPASRSEIFRPSDPRPFLRESVDWLRRR